jgi:hypothetical protein
MILGEIFNREISGRCVPNFINSGATVRSFNRPPGLDGEIILEKRQFFFSFRGSFPLFWCGSACTEPLEIQDGFKFHLEEGK